MTVIRLTTADFRPVTKEYIGTVDLSSIGMDGLEIDVPGNGHVSFINDIHCLGSIKSNTSIEAKFSRICCMSLIVSGFVRAETIICLGNLTVGGNMRTSGSVYASYIQAETITCGGDVEATRNITTGSIHATCRVVAGSITSDRGITAGLTIECGGTLETNGRVFAGISPEAHSYSKTVTCGRLRGTGKVESGTLIENGMTLAKLMKEVHV